MTATVTDRDRDRQVQEELERLRKEYDVLKKRQIQAEADLRAVGERLAELKKKAEEAYGTSDLDELKALLERWRNENERNVKEYREHIEKIKEELNRIEQRVSE